MCVHVKIYVHAFITFACTVCCELGEMAMWACSLILLPSLMLFH